ncbi:MAG TPA: glycosyltransferase [Acidimicrobiales bacterium]|nr:glycosyltransferase [Acidimicrobiales bacterium]
MGRLAVLSLHTSPLAQPGAGDGGGMNVYVRSLSSALARAGLDCDVYTRAWRPGLAPVVAVEPGVRVHHVPAGPPSGVTKEDLPELVDEFTDGVLARILSGGEPDLIHANYWLSGVAGHALKHELGLPLVCTFHTLARVKAEATGEEAGLRGQAEAEVVGCSDAVLASAEHERVQLARLYDADPARIEVVPPGVDHERFAAGDRRAARRALRLGDGPVLLFVGRIQPLKGVDVAVEVAARCRPDTTLLVVGGPSGAEGEVERRRVAALVDELGMGGRVRFVPPQPHHRLATFYRAADVCLVPSRSESFGLVALEAAACGTPVVAAAVGGLQTLVEHARTGFLVDVGDAAAFAACVRALLDDPARAAAMGDAAIARSRRYSWSITAARVRRLCADLTARAPVECQ